MKTLAAILASAAGLATAIALTVPAVALAWSPSNLPPGFRLTHTTVGGATSCPEYYQFVAPAVSNEFCLDSPTYQQDFDAWVDAHYTPPASTTAPTTTAATTTTDAATTTTTAAAPPPGDPAVTTTAAPPTQTVTVTVTTTDPTIESRVAALEAQYAALAARVDANAQANTAAWSAFVDALNAGASPADAALAARSAGLNAIYQLG